MHFNYYTVLLLASSIFISGIIGIFKFSQIPDEYRPFIYLIWVGCFNEVIGVYLAYRYHNNIASNIIYTLCESLLLIWFFKKLGMFENKKKWLIFLIVLFVVMWFANSFLTGRFGDQFTFYFDGVYAFCVVILSIQVINSLLFTQKELLKNPAFLICIGLMIFFSYQIIDRTFRLVGLNNSEDFRKSVSQLLHIINFLVNLIFALAVLRMRKKRAFTLQFQ